MHGGQQLVGIIAPSAGRALAAPIVLVAELSQSLISGPPVGDDRRARLDVIHHERVQGLGRGIGQWRHAAPPQSSRLMNLNCDTGQHLLAPSAATGQPRLGAADVGLVHLYRPAQQIPTGTYQHRPQAVQHGPGSLVGADLQYSLQAQRRDPVFTGGEQPAGGVPYRQGCPRPIEDRTGRHRTACRTRRTHEAAIAQAPTALRGRNSDRRSRRATAAIRGSPGSPHRFETRLETRQPSPGSACQREDTPCTEHMVTPVKWIPPKPAICEHDGR